MRLCKHGKSALFAFIKQLLKIRANLKRHNRVYILSSKHTNRPMRARVIAQLKLDRNTVHVSISYLLSIDCNVRDRLAIKFAQILAIKR